MQIDALKVKRYEENKNKKSGRGIQKIEGPWKNPMSSNINTQSQGWGYTDSPAAEVKFTGTQSINKRSVMSMEDAMQIQLAELSQKMMDTLRKDQVEINNRLRQDLDQMQRKINDVELKHERDVKEMKDSIQQGNAVVMKTLDEMKIDSNQKALAAAAAVEVVVQTAAQAAVVAAQARAEVNASLNQLMNMLSTQQSNITSLPVSLMEARVAVAYEMERAEQYAQLSPSANTEMKEPSTSNKRQLEEDVEEAEENDEEMDDSDIYRQDLEKNKERSRAKGNYKKTSLEEAFEINVTYHEHGKEDTTCTIQVKLSLTVEELKYMLLPNVSINGSNFEPGYHLGQDDYDNETWGIGALSQTDTSTIHIYSRDSDGNVQIRTLSQKELSLDIGNAATKDSASNIMDVVVKNAVVAAENLFGEQPFISVVTVHRQEGDTSDVSADNSNQAITGEAFWPLTSYSDDMQQGTNSLRSLHGSPDGPMSRRKITGENVPYPSLLLVGELGEDRAFAPVLPGLQGGERGGIPSVALSQPNLTMLNTDIENLKANDKSNQIDEYREVSRELGQFQYVNESDRINWLPHFTTFMIILAILSEYFWTNGMAGVDNIRLLTMVELSLSCRCANTTDSASFLPPPVASLTTEESYSEEGMKDQLDAETEADFRELARKSWRGDVMESNVPEGNQLFASFNANGQVYVDHDKIGSSIWSRLHDLIKYQFSSYTGY